MDRWDSNKPKRQPGHQHLVERLVSTFAFNSSKKFSKSTLPVTSAGGALAVPRRGRDLVLTFLHLMVTPTRALARLP